jgi:hypothetical protein
MFEKDEYAKVIIPEDNLPQLLKDALDDSKDYVYISNIVRIRE